MIRIENDRPGGLSHSAKCRTGLLACLGLILFPLLCAAEEFASLPAYKPAERRHWAFQPRQDIKPPTFTTAADTAWIRTPIDAFVLDRLKKAGLRPAPAADRATLIRRATFDLHGLPPTVEEVDAFVNDRSPDAWEKVVDRLLASPRYGEQWARHWL